MNIRFPKLVNIILCIFLLTACGPRSTSAPDNIPNIPPTVAPPTNTPVSPTPTTAPVKRTLPSLSITLGANKNSQGIRLDQGGDVDTIAESRGEPAVETRSSGNNHPLPATDGNNVRDSYLQFNVDDGQLFRGNPTSHVRVEVDYFDAGNDSFLLEYDALSGRFAGGGSVVKTNTNTFLTATFNLCDASFANGDNGADFRISDNGDGAESLRAVRVIGLPSADAQTVNVDDYGANPFDNQPDSAAIQGVLDSSCSGDTIVFTSGVDTPGYTGYLIDKTLFLTGMSAKHNLTFTSSDPNNHALLRATADLKGFVMRLYARTRFNNAGDIDDIDFGNIDVHGGRDVRVCSGPDDILDGHNDNWGSWLRECTATGDPWCSPGGIGLDGGSDWEDVLQSYRHHPNLWTTGVVIHDVVDQQVECGTALAFFSAGGTIRNVTIDTAGDHVHAAGCAFTDNDGDQSGWSDGITLFGPGHTVTDNTIINPSDVGIVFFGGKDTVIANNTIKVSEGNYGAFAGIAIHPWILGDVSGTQLNNNHVSSEGDTRCGGIHAGINIGPQMWGGGCVRPSRRPMFGNNGSCSETASLETVAACTGGLCQLWAFVSSGSTFWFQDNLVTGAHINYLIEGFAVLGEFIDQNNVSQTPRLSDWYAAGHGCFGVRWNPMDKVAHHPSLPGYTDRLIHCER